MSYEVHITRRKNWIDNEGEAISEQDWVQYIKNDPEMELQEEASDDGIHGKSVGVWKSGNKGEGMNVYWSKRGEVVLYGPRDEEQIKKMVAIAQVLRAKLQGDDGEVYDADGSTSVAPDSQLTANKSVSNSQLKVPLAFIGYLLLLMSVIGVIGTQASNFDFSTKRIVVYTSWFLVGVLFVYLSRRMKRNP